jgi:hypothetical protein
MERIMCPVLSSIFLCMRSEGDLEQRIVNHNCTVPFGLWIVWNMLFNLLMTTLQKIELFLNNGAILTRIQFSFSLQQRVTGWAIPTCRCSDRGGPKPTSKCCVSLSWMVMQGKHTGVYPGSGKRRPYVQRGGKVCISLHRGARVGVTSMRERVSSPSLKEKRGKRWLLEMSISCFVFSFRLCPLR